MSQQAAKRRRAQAKMGFKHIAPRVRPHYKKRSNEVLAARLQRVIANERRMTQKKKN